VGLVGEESMLSELEERERVRLLRARDEGLGGEGS
jgi:hypothetical protein